MFFDIQKTSFKNFILENSSILFDIDDAYDEKKIKITVSVENPFYDKDNPYDKKYDSASLYLSKTDIEGLYILEAFSAIYGRILNQHKAISQKIEEILQKKGIKAIGMKAESSNFINFIENFKQKGYNSIKYGEYIIFSKDKKYLKDLYNKLFNTKNDQKDNALEAAKKILKDCKPFLNEINYEVKEFKMYRGMGEANKVFIKKKTRLEDRKPKDMPADYHKVLNQKMKELFGYPFRNGLFVTGSKSEARGYAKSFVKHDIEGKFVYTIFPIGDFEYIWSQNVPDLYTQFSDYGYDLDDLIYLLETEYEFNENLDEAIKSENEIMIWTKEYYAIATDTEFENRVLDYIEKYKKEKE